MASEDKPVVIPVTREEASVTRSRVETGVVSERIEVIDEPMLHDEVDIEHVPMNRPVAAPEPPREEGDVQDALVERRAPDVRGST